MRLRFIGGGVDARRGGVRNYRHCSKMVMELVPSFIERRHSQPSTLGSDMIGINRAPEPPAARRPPPADLHGTSKGVHKCG
ncbi:hypothetical protein [Dactylosporangium sp. NPDC005555]|uniref:hypothetical protein n=1 Tax=Dactylosporangium sp. NPDC005555 TaxID=3154889 RepID=UPI0033B72F57